MLRVFFHYFCRFTTINYNLKLQGTIISVVFVQRTFLFKLFQLQTDVLSYNHKQEKLKRRIKKKLDYVSHVHNFLDSNWMIIDRSNSTSAMCYIMIRLLLATKNFTQMHDCMLDPKQHKVPTYCLFIYILCMHKYDEVLLYLEYAIRGIIISYMSCLFYKKLANVEIMIGGKSSEVMTIGHFEFVLSFLTHPTYTRDVPKRSVCREILIFLLCFLGK